jgi:hypothetical protein
VFFPFCGPLFKIHLLENITLYLSLRYLLLAMFFFFCVVLLSPMNIGVVTWLPQDERGARCSQANVF